MLSGARRLGKTSPLQRLAEEAEAQGWQACLIDVEGIDSADAFVDELARAFPDATVVGHVKTAPAAITRTFSPLRKADVRVPGVAGFGLELQALPDTPWRKAALAVQERVSGRPVLFLIDEFSVFLEKLLARDAADGERLLGWLRAWRQQSALACRFVFSGSIGLNALLYRHRLSTRFNDCTDSRLGPFKPGDALAMLAELARREEWPAAADSLEYLCRRVGWLSPYYLHLLLDGSPQAARELDEPMLTFTLALLAAVDAAVAGIDPLPVAAQEDAALTLLTDWLAEHRQRVVLLIDSSDLLFANLTGGGTARKEQRSVADPGATPLWRLRKTLSHQPGIFWIGASHQALEAQHHYHDAFRDFFELYELRPLGVDQMRQALLALARVFGFDGRHGDAAAAAPAARLDA